MKTTRILFLVVLWLSGSVLFNTCQNEEFDDQTLSLTGDDYISEEEAIRESALLVIENQSACINPDDPVFVENTQQETAQWGNPKSPFVKTVDIAYYNTLTHFVLKVKSTHGWADLVIDGESVWVDGPVGENAWGEYSVELPIGWAAGDANSFALTVAGYGPPARFEVQYALIGVCTYYDLSLDVSLTGAGNVTGAGTYGAGVLVPLTATANTGYAFVNWTDGLDVVSTVANFDYEMPAYDVILTANFEEELTVWPRDTETEVVDVYNPATGKTWMDRNLGASRAATTPYDAEAHGDLYQWGRAADGHQKRTSGTTYTLSDSDTPGHGNFILATDYTLSGNWLLSQNPNLWQGANGINNPCPVGFRLPTEAEWEEERQSWNSNDAAGAFASSLKLTVAGFRHFADIGQVHSVGFYGHYWSSTVNGPGSLLLHFQSDDAYMYLRRRGYGSSVRCIKD
jgi:uncharacterized protein (TIGR02145 family)